MSKLKDLMSKGKPLTLSNGLELIIKPMRLEVEAEIGELYEQKKTTTAIMVMVKDAIKIAVPDVTDEEIDCMNKEDLKLITKKVLEVNGLGGNPEKKSTPN